MASSVRRFRYDVMTEFSVIQVERLCYSLSSSQDERALRPSLVGRLVEILKSSQLRVKGTGRGALSSCDDESE